MKRIPIVISVVATAALIIAGCSVGPDYHPPQMVVPGSFGPLEPTSSSTAPTTGLVSRRVNVARWWEVLEDDQLNSLVQRAVASNLDLRIAGARLQEARALEFATTGGAYPGIGYLPGVDLNAGAGRGSGSDSTRGRVPTLLTSASNTKNFSEITQVIGLDAGWELDLFGHYSRLVEASQADVQVVAEARNEILVSLAADVVRAYAEVRSNQYRLEVARQNLDTQRKTLDLVRVRLKRQLGSDLEVAQAERQLSASLARIGPLEAALGSSKRRVAVLVGQFPDELKNQLDQPGLLPATPPNVTPGMPVELLRRRPDIRRIEREIAAATARIGIATADLFPRVSVIGATGIEGQGLGRSPEKARYIYSIGPSLYWPLLDFGRLDSVIQIQDFRTQQLLLTYQRAVISAVQEVDDALNNYGGDQDSLLQLGNAVASSKRAAELAQQRYDIGLTDFLNVLDAERQLFDLQDQYAVAQANVVRDFVTLYKAMGGGWQGWAAVPMPNTPKPAILAEFDRFSTRHSRPAGNAQSPSGN